MKPPFPSASMGGELLHEFISYLAVVENDSATRKPVVIRRQPELDRQGTPFPAGVAAFAIASAPPARRPAEKTAVLTLEDGTRLYVASLSVRDAGGKVQAICALARRPLLRQRWSHRHHRLWPLAPQILRRHQLQHRGPLTRRRRRRLHLAPLTRHHHQAMHLMGAATAIRAVTVSSKRPRRQARTLRPQPYA